MINKFVTDVLFSPFDFSSLVLTLHCIYFW
jgi:hypothetical protein